MSNHPVVYKRRPGTIDWGRTHKAEIRPAKPRPEKLKIVHAA